MLNPLDLALNFIPVVGVGAKGAEAMKLAGQGTRLSRTLSRGLIANETIEAAGLGLKGYTAAVIEGSVGNAIGEIPLLLANRQDQTRYTAGDFALAVGLGGVFGGAIHTAGLALKHAFRVHEKLTPETRENMAGVALEDFLRGDHIDPGRLSLLDDNVRTTAMRLASHTTPLEPRTTPSRIAPTAIPTPDTAPVKGFTKSKMVVHEITSTDGKTSTLTVTHNPTKGEIRMQDTSPKAIEYGAVKAGNKEGRFKVESAPGVHDSFNTRAAAVAYAEHLAETKKSEGATVVTKDGNTPVEPKSEVKQTPEEEQLSEFDRLVNELPEDPVSPEAETDHGRKQIKSYAEYESKKKSKKQNDLDKEIKDGNTMETPEAHRFGDLPTPEEIARINDEIRMLQEEVGIEYPEFRSLNDKYIPWQRWSAFLPEPVNKRPDGRMPDKPIYTLEDISYAAGEIDPNSRAVLDQMFDLDPTLRDLQVTIDYELTITHEAAGLYRSMDDDILLSPWHMSPANVVHETAHAQVAIRLRKEANANHMLGIFKRGGENYLRSLRGFATMTNNKGITKLIEAYLASVENLPKHLRDGINKPDYVKNGGQYGHSNLDEFISEGLSNPEFQKILSEIKMPESDTALSRLYRAIKDIFGLSDKPGTALEKLLDGYEEAVRTGGTRRGYGDRQTLPKATVTDLTAAAIKQAGACSIL